MTETAGKRAEPRASSWLLVAGAWIAVGIPLLWGVWMTLKKAAQLFR
jgi:predicted signal transduction protein with EAL and GGDEF domain